MSPYTSIGKGKPSHANFHSDPTALEYPSLPVRSVVAVTAHVPYAHDPLRYALTRWRLDTPNLQLSLFLIYVFGLVLLFFIWEICVFVVPVLPEM